MITLYLHIVEKEDMVSLIWMLKEDNGDIKEVLSVLSIEKTNEEKLAFRLKHEL